MISGLGTVNRTSVVWTRSQHTHLEPRKKVLSMRDGLLLKSQETQTLYNLAWAAKIIVALELLLTYITNKLSFSLQDSLLCAGENSNFWNWHTDPSWFSASSLAVSPAPLYARSSQKWACACFPSPWNVSSLILIWLVILTHPYLTGDTREACPATLPMTHHWLRYPFCGHPQGLVFTSVVGFITLFWFDFHASVSPSLTINSSKNMVVGLFPVPST